MLAGVFKLDLPSQSVAMHIWRMDLLHPAALMRQSSTHLCDVFSAIAMDDS